MFWNKNQIKKFWTKLDYTKWRSFTERLFESHKQVENMIQLFGIDPSNYVNQKKNTLNEKSFSNISKIIILVIPVNV